MKTTRTINSAESTLSVGMLVSHPRKPEWGPGKVLAIDRLRVTVYWRDLEGASADDAVKPMARSAVTLEPCENQSDPLLDNLPEFKDGKLSNTGPQLTLEEGIAEFLHYFPKGFDDPKFLGVESKSERLYKMDAHDQFVKLLGDGKYGKLLHRDDIKTITNHVLAVEGKVNLLSKFERIAFRDALKDEAAAREYYTALHGMLESPSVEREAFEAMIAATSNLPSDGQTSPFKWTVLTLMPFLARPDTYMFMKPAVTQACADRLPFNLNYSSKPNWLTYSKLMEMSDLLMERLRELGAKDYIDIQSFIWVIDYYGKVGHDSKGE